MRRIAAIPRQFARGIIGVVGAITLLILLAAAGHSLYSLLAM